MAALLIVGRYTEWLELIAAVTMCFLLLADSAIAFYSIAIGFAAVSLSMAFANQISMHRLNI